MDVDTLRRINQTKIVILIQQNEACYQIIIFFHSYSFHIPFRLPGQANEYRYAAKEITL